ncbi:DUF3592 domain-containing protein [Saccharopolyspora sp. NFXS83]|uniref:DUF3592 domain-containing protein n=1 Tax=Saccharopolyspora sp. NFXS83 TaxID=2993560 RepID=UPI00224B6D9A|nr:DUF3592 domain-containing protein [Saccharopolyspora sp. NFXS83]MCX2731566.1 DUF3592 domain-containing protein [Saccharopolyspora sp. NFXS83]
MITMDGLPGSILAWIICSVFFALGLGCLWHGGREVRVTRRLQDRGVRTTATVIRHKPGSALDQPVYGYTDHRGARFTLEPGRIHNTFTPVGDRADVLYLPEHPETSRLAESEGTPWKGATPAFAIGAAMCLGTVAFMACLLFIPAGGFHTTSSPPLVMIFGLVGVPLLVLAIPVVRITRLVRLRRTGIRTEGVVVREADRSNRWLVDFVDHDGRRIQFTSGHTGKRAGARVPVVYRRARPQQAEVASLAPALRENGFIAVVALFFLAMAALAF